MNHTKTTTQPVPFRARSNSDPAGTSRIQLSANSHKRAELEATRAQFSYDLALARRKTHQHQQTADNAKSFNTFLLLFVVNPLLFFISPALSLLYATGLCIRTLSCASPQEKPR